jgi:hypothetical protein
MSKMTQVTRSVAWPTLTQDNPSLVDDIIVEAEGGSIVIEFYRFRGVGGLSVKVCAFTDAWKTLRNEKVAGALDFIAKLAEMPEGIDVETAENALRVFGIMPDPKYPTRKGAVT